MELTAANRLIIQKVFEVFKYLKRRWILVVLITALSTLFFLYQEYSAKTFYKGSFSFILDDEDLGASSGGGSMNGNPLTALFSQSGNNNKTLLLEIIQSAKVLEQTLLTKKTVDSNNNMLANHFLEHGGFRKKWKKKDNKRMLAFKFKNSYIADNEKMSNGIMRSLAVSLSQQIKTSISDGGVIYVSFRNTNEEFTKGVLDAVYENVNSYYTHNKTARAQEMVRYSKHRFDSIRKALGGAEGGLASFRDRNWGMMSSRGNANISRYGRKIGVLQMLYSEAFASYELAKVQLAQKKPLIRILDDVRYPLSKTKKHFVFKGIVGFVFGLIISILLIIGYYFASYYIKEFREAYNTVTN